MKSNTLLLALLLFLAGCDIPWTDKEEPEAVGYHYGEYGGYYFDGEKRVEYLDLHGACEQAYKEALPYFGPVVILDKSGQEKWFARGKVHKRNLERCGAPS